MEKPENNQGANRPSAACGTGKGALPGYCAPLAFPYIPVQDENPVRYSRMEALQTGTLFPGLDLPFKAAIRAKTKMANTALVELMALDFAIDELGLYLVTHADDQEVLRLYWSYIKLAQEGREKYQKMYGPLLQTDLTPEDGYAWLKDPWPWEVGGND
ncbi:MAG: spore coat associated protein CotJA [Ruminococcaceae bacterium]|nr:spore coat associated protein CotJA [Oscillospiraceae bacterium]